MPPLARRTLLLACLLTSGMTYYYFALLLPNAHASRAARDLGKGYTYGCDFYCVWLTSHELLIHGVNPYTVDMSRKIQKGLYGRTIDPQRRGDPLQNFGIYPYPLYVDFLAAPLGLLSFPMARIVGSILFPLLVGAVVLLWLSAINLRLQPGMLFIAFILSFTSYPILEGLYALQLTLIVAALVAGSAAALVTRRLGWAGALLAGASAKPHLILLPALFLALWAASDLRGRKIFLLSFIGTIACLFGVSEAVLPGWSATWIHALFEYRKYNDPPLAQFILGPIGGNLVALGLIATAAILAFRTRQAGADSPQFAATLVLLLAITVPVLPSSVAVYDQILLLPAILWLVSRRDQVLDGGTALRILGYAALAAISWQWIAASGVALCSFLFPAMRNSWSILLPLRMAASVPFAIIGLCLFLTWKGKPLHDGFEGDAAAPAAGSAPNGLTSSGAELHVSDNN